MNKAAAKPSVQLDSAMVLTKALRSAQERLGLTNRVLANVLGTSEASVSRFNRGRLLDPEGAEGQLALLLLRLFRSLDALVGGDEGRARLWLHAQNGHLGGTPVDRIQTIEGLVHVVDYLDGMRGHL